MHRDMDDSWINISVSYITNNVGNKYEFLNWKRISFSFLINVEKVKKKNSFCLPPYE